MCRECVIFSYFMRIASINVMFESHHLKRSSVGRVPLNEPATYTHTHTMQSSNLICCRKLNCIIHLRLFICACVSHFMINLPTTLPWHRNDGSIGNFWPTKFNKRAKNAHHVDENLKNLNNFHVYTRSWWLRYKRVVVRNCKSCKYIGFAI